MKGLRFRHVLAAVTISMLPLIANATPPPGAYYALGDSITYGIGTSAQGKEYPALVARAERKYLVNLGISGAKVMDVLTIEVPQVDASAGLITVNVGVNDEIDTARGRESKEANERGLRAIARALHARAPHAEILFLTPSDHARLIGVAAHNDPAMVAAVHAVTLDFDRTIRSLGERVCDVGDDTRYYERAHFNADVLHPNDAGAAFIAAKTTECLK